MAEYDVVGYIVRKRESASGAEGCVGCLVIFILLGLIGSCIGERINFGKASPPNESARQAEVSHAPIAPQTATRIPQSTVGQPRMVEQRVHCRACSGKGVKTGWATCPTCNGQRKVVDQARTAQNAVSGIVNGMARGRHSRPPRSRTYYMSCPSCNGKGRIPRQEGCGQCGGSGFLLKR